MKDVLIVDDDPVALAVLEAALRALGRVTISATDGLAAWEILQHTAVRQIVSDWRMPGLDGLELCRRVRDRPGDYVYFILLTQSSGSTVNLDAANEAGVDDFLTKPVNATELARRLRVADRILGFTKQMQQLESFLPICGYCKNIRDDKNYWQRIEEYINTRTGANFSHAICPDCMENVIKPQLAKIGKEIPPGF